MVVNVPGMGDSISEGTIVEWLKQPGDSVEADEVVVVIETDKVSVDVRSPQAGVFGQAMAEPDATVEVGQPLFSLGSAAGGGPAPPTPSPPKPAEAAAPMPEPASAPPAATPLAAGSGDEMVVPVPSMGDSISEGTVVEWVKNVGDAVAPDDVVVVLETDKVSVDVRSPQGGVLVKQLAVDQDTVSVGAPLFALDTSASPAPAAAPAASTPLPPPPVEAAAPPSPPPEPVAPPPPKPAASAPASAPAPAPAPAKAKPAPPVGGATAPVGAAGGRKETRVKMNRMRQRIAERLKSAQNTAAMLTTFQECDMGNVIDMRKAYKDEFEKKHGIKLGFMSAFVKASTAALQQIPAVNAYIDDATKEIVYREYVDISVAVSSPTGLVVPVLRNCEEMSFADVEKSIAMYGKKAKEGTLALEDMAGGTFTISNGGVFGSLMGTPIINPPQSAILGMHATKLRPVVKDGQVVPRPMMYLALTYDHRLIDGREAVTFLKSIAEKIEDPKRLILGI